MGGKCGEKGGVMGIEITCPNGHQLRIKEKYAGKAGLCPKCRAAIHVPALVPSSIDDLIDLVPRPPVKHVAAFDPAADDNDDDPMPAHTAHSPSRAGDSLLSSSSLVKHHKVCPKCFQVAPIWFARCQQSDHFFRD
jgi:hypothetical protein